jgi:rod shape-determining protein MreD
MSRSSWQGLDTTARSLTPSLLLLILIFIGQLPFSLTGHATATPFFVLMAVYYWGLHRPDLLPAVMVFLAGLLQDALEGEPFGVNAFVLIAVYWLTVSQQRHFREQPFLIVWLGFMGVGLMAQVMRWILVSLMQGAAVTPWTVTLEYALTIAFYPVLTVAFALAHRTLPRAASGEFMD